MMQAISRRSINHQFLNTSAVKSLTSFSNSGFGVGDDHHPRYGSTLANKGVGHLVRKGTGGRSSVRLRARNAGLSRRRRRVIRNANLDAPLGLVVSRDVEDCNQY